MDETARRESELLDLLSAAWDDRLDAKLRARLEALLSQDDYAAIEFLTSCTRLHLDLEWLVSSKSAQDKAFASLRKIRAEHRDEMHRHPKFRSLGFVGIAASIVLVVLCVRYYFARPGLDQLVRAPQPVARIVRLEDADWVAGSGLQSGDSLMEGQTLDVKKGFAQVSMGFGADVLLEGPCRARIISSDRVALERGKLAVRAAKWAVGFKVATDDFVATDLGTWFSIQTGGGLPEIHVLEGQVVANSLKQSGWSKVTHRLQADEAVHMTHDGEFQAIQFRREAAAEKLTKFQPLRPIQVWNTGIGLREGDNDPHWTVTQGDSRTGPFPQPAVVSVPHASYGINEPERSQWISVDRGTTKGVPARSKYTFETTFDLSGFELGTVWISGLVLADDGVDEVWLNGQRLTINRWTDWTYGINYVKFHPIEIRSGFVAGVNRLSLVVKNESFIVPSDKGFDVPDTPNPMALRTEWQAFGRPLIGPE
jgi:hypothetical protein